MRLPLFLAGLACLSAPALAQNIASPVSSDDEGILVRPRNAGEMPVILESFAPSPSCPAPRSSAMARRLWGRLWPPSRASQVRAMRPVPPAAPSFAASIISACACKKMASARMMSPSSAKTMPLPSTRSSVTALMSFAAPPLCAMARKPSAVSSMCRTTASPRSCAKM